MFLLRQSIQSFYAKIQELVTAEGFIIGTDLAMMMSYPKKDDQLPIIRPLIIVSNIGGFDTPIELGSADGSEILIIIDVVAKDAGQRDDLGHMLVKSLRNKQLPIYDFSAKFPTTIGDYTGINTVGKMVVMGTSFNNVDPDINDVWTMSHHQEIRVRVSLPSD